MLDLEDDIIGQLPLENRKWVEQVKHFLERYEDNVQNVCNGCFVQEDNLLSQQYWAFFNLLSQQLLYILYYIACVCRLEGWVKQELVLGDTDL